VNFWYLRDFNLQLTPPKNSLKNIEKCKLHFVRSPPPENLVEGGGDVVGDFQWFSYPACPPLRSSMLSMKVKATTYGCWPVLVAGGIEKVYLAYFSRCRILLGNPSSKNMSSRFIFPEEPYMEPWETACELVDPYFETNPSANAPPPHSPRCAPRHALQSRRYGPSWPHAAACQQSPTLCGANMMWSLL